MILLCQPSLIKEMYKAILWDNDGVLVDTETLYFQASRDVLASIGIELTHHQFIDISLRNGRSLFDLAVEQSDEEIMDLKIKRDETYHQLLNKGVTVIDQVEADPTAFDPLAVDFAFSAQGNSQQSKTNLLSDIDASDSLDEILEDLLGSTGQSSFFVHN